MAKPWERDWSGGQQIAPADPRLPFQTQEARNKAAASAIDPARAQAELRGQNLQNDLNALNQRIAAQELADKERKAEEERVAKTEGEKAKAANLSKVARTIERLDAIAKDASDNGGWFETGALGALLRSRPGTAAYDLAGKVAGVRGANFVEAIRQLKEASKTGATGAGGLTETEGKKLEDALAVLDPNMSHQEFLDQVNQARDTYLESYRRLGGADPQIDPDGANMAPPANSEQFAPAKDTQTQIDPLRKGVMTRVGQMVVQPNANRQKVEQFIRENGMNPGDFNLPELFKWRQSPDFIKWQRANPGKALAPDPRFYTRETPLAGMNATMNNVAQSPAGAYFANAANALSGNHLDNLGGEGVNTALQVMQSQNPNASFLGDLSGQALVALGTRRVPGLNGLGGRANQALGDAAYGAYSGHGQGDILGGAVSNAAGGALFRGGARALGAAARGVTSPSLSYLNQQGVPLTIGQIGRGSDSIVGQAVGGLEDRAAGVPIFDAIINTARRRGEEGFNSAAFRQAGGKGATGAAGVNEIGNLVNDAYSFLDPAQIPVDAQFAGSQAGVRASLPGLPAFGEQIGKGMDQIDNLGPVIPGRDWQSAIRSVRGDRSSIAGQPFADRAVGTLGDVEDNLLTLAERQVPGAVDNLSSANRLNGQYQTLLSALDNGPSQSRGELFSPSRLDTASRQGARNYGGRAASMRGERPFYDLTKAGMDVMPNQVPDSGTAGRALMYSALFGAGLGSGLGAGGSAAAGGDAGDGAGFGAGAGAASLPFMLAALYSKPGQKGIQRALLGSRPDAFKKVGEALLKRDKTAGIIGAALMRDLYLQPELPPTAAR